MRLSEMKSLAQAEDFCKGNVLKCILGLCDLDVLVFYTVKEERRSIKEIAEKVERDRSSVQRSAKNLVASGLLSREGTSMNRGRKYVYSAITTEKLKEILISRIDKYCGKLKEKVETMN